MGKGVELLKKKRESILRPERLRQCRRRIRKVPFEFLKAAEKTADFPEVFFPLVRGTVQFRQIPRHFGRKFGVFCRLFHKISLFLIFFTVYPVGIFLKLHYINSVNLFFMEKKEPPMSSFYVTTPIYYVNDKPHIGHRK